LLKILSLNISNDKTRDYFTMCPPWVLDILKLVVGAERGAGVTEIGQQLDLFAWCVRLSRVLVGFQTALKINALSFIRSFERRVAFFPAHALLTNCKYGTKKW